MCVIAEDQVPSCEESKMDINPLTFEVPSSLTPFKLRIQVEAIGREDIVFVDSVRYEGRFCEILGPVNFQQIENNFIFFKNSTHEFTVSTLPPTTKMTRKLSHSISELPKKRRLFGATNLVQNEV